MDKWQALHSFWNSFGIPAYDETTVPDDAVEPYITYEAGTSSIDEVVMLTASLWYRSNAWNSISAKADEIANFIGDGGASVQYDNGRLWIIRGDTFAQRMAEPSDDMIRRIVLQIYAEFQ